MADYQRSRPLHHAPLHSGVMVPQAIFVEQPLWGPAPRRTVLRRPMSSLIIHVQIPALKTEFTSVPSYAFMYIRFNHDFASAYKRLWLCIYVCRLVAC